MTAKKENPYTLSFGKEPLSFIQRDFQSDDIIESFLSNNPTYQVSMFTGVRGSGKTVALTNIANRIGKHKDWIVVNLNPERDLIKTLAAELSNRKELLQLFKDAKINLSVFGLGLEISGTPSIMDEAVILRKMLKKLTEKGKKVLVTIDEVTPSKEFRIFANQFQIFIREKLNIFLLMSGLYENIENLQNEKTLTFLYRSPKIELKPLNLSLIKKSYEDNLKVNKLEAKEMAIFTKGYAFAFQLLGYLCYKKHKKLKEVIDDFDVYIEEYVYEKIWSECSEKDKKILSTLGEEPIKIEKIRKATKMKTNEISVYRKRLMKKGLVTSSNYGELELSLPRFKQFIENNY